jgi:homoserine kinase
MSSELRNLNEVTVRAPATVANVACGFDCLGFALETPFDEITLRRVDRPGIRIEHLDGFGLPTDPARNVVGTVLGSVIRAAGGDLGFEAVVTKHIKPGSGVGSSAASASAAAVAANELLGSPFSRPELVEFARDGEFTACGARIADNVSASIFGGFTLVRTTEPTADVIALEFPELHATVLHPQIEIKTADARALLRNEIPLPTAVRQWGNVGALVAGLARGDYGLIGRALEDFVAEPYRKVLIPGFDDLKSASLRAGALGGGISGSGPSVFMLSANGSAARAVESAMDRVYSGSGIDYNIYVSPVSRTGAATFR